MKSLEEGLNRSCDAELLSGDNRWFEDSLFFLINLTFVCVLEKDGE